MTGYMVRHSALPTYTLGWKPALHDVAPRRELNLLMGTVRCEWAGTDPLLISYHDAEWGVPLHDNRRLFEFLLLEGAQAGLSWSTILHKRDDYREAFDGFDPRQIARYGDDKVQALLANSSIVRNRLKIRSAVNNARAYLKLLETVPSFDQYIWEFVGGKSRNHRWQRQADIPATTLESDAMSRSLKRRGFSFVGPTICYAFMQAIGMVNDHTVDCFRHAEIAAHCASQAL